MRKSKLLKLIGSICLVLVLVALPFTMVSPAPPGEKKPTTTELEKLIEGAKKEGKLVIYADFAPQTQQAIHSAFKKRYPFIKQIEQLAIGAADVVNRIQTESAAAAYQVDVAGTGAGSFIPLLKAGRLQAVDWAALGVPAEAIDFPQQVTCATIIYPICYNTDLVSAAKAPKTYDEFLDPKWKGKIGLWSGSFAFAELVPTLGGEYVTNLLKGIMANEAMVFRRGNAVQLAAGEVAIGMNFTADMVKQRIAERAPVAYHWADPIPTSRWDLAVVANAPHPNAAKLFIKWFTTPEAAQIYLEFEMRGNVFIPGSGDLIETKGMRYSTFSSDRLHERQDWIQKLGKIIMP